MSKHHRSTGLTLVEIMIVVCIIAMLAAVAVPGYQAYVRRANRTEAHAALLRAAQWLERVATATGGYLKNAEALPDTLKRVSSERYVIELSVRDEGIGYILTATPRGAQARDACGVLTLDHAGERGLAAADASDKLKAECWGR